MLVFAGAVMAQETDLSVVVFDSVDPAEPDSTVSFEIEMANAGPGDPNNDPDNFVVIDVYLPMGVPVPFIEYLQADEDGRQAIADAFFAGDNVTYDENIWDAGNEESGFYFGDTRNNACNGLLLQASPMVLPAGTSGKIYYDAALPEIGVAGFAYRNALGEMVSPNFQGSGCSNTFDGCYVSGGVPCMGPRLTMYEASGAPLTLVNDESDYPSEGCDPLVDFPVGNVALIDRGTCGFQDKMNNAVDAGASGAIIANYAGGGTTVDEDGVILMGCNSDTTCHELIIPIPGVFLSTNSGLALKAAMAEGEVLGFVGIRQEDPNYTVTEANLWELGTETDTNLDNNRFTETTTFGEFVFIDGFESGDTFEWDYTGPDPSPLQPGTWQWLIDSQCNGSFEPYTLIFYADGFFLSPERCSGFEDLWSQNGRAIEFSFTSCDGIYSGILNNAGTFMSGTVSWGGCWQATRMFMKN